MKTRNLFTTNSSAMLPRKLPRRFSSYTMTPATQSLADGLLRGDRVSLSRSVTLVESSNPEHSKQAEALLEYVLKHRPSTSRAFRIGITGPPGGGKSTFIETFGSMLCKDFNKKLAVLAIDPSSTRSKGSILGDKTRMTKLSVEPNAFVRPSPSRGRLGGIAQFTSDVVLLVESAGFDTVLVETVGLGQSEIVVDDCVDMLFLLVPPANGDELQGVKKGIMEVADLVIVNKADGALADLASHAVVDYSHAVMLARRKRPEWRPRVRKCSSLTGEDIKVIWEDVEKFKTRLGGEIDRKRQEQSITWMWTEFQDQIAELARDDKNVLSKSKEMEFLLNDGKIAPRHAARDLVHEFLTKKIALRE